MNTSDMRPYWICLSIAFVWVSPASAATFTGPAGRWAQRESSRLSVPGPAGVVWVGQGNCPYLPVSDHACSQGDHVYADDVVSLMHELGHQFDYNNLDDGERATLAPELGLAGVAWMNCGAVDVAGYGRCPAERFADAYQSCAFRNTPPAHERTQPFGYGWTPTRAMWRRVCHQLWIFTPPPERKS